MLQNLNPEIRFNVIAFSSTIRALGGRAAPVSQPDLAEAREFINRLTSRGGTNIYGALTETLQQSEAGRPQGDRLPHRWATPRARCAARRSPQGRARPGTSPTCLFTFGVGYDVEHHPARHPHAEEHHGASTYVQPEEDIETAVASFYDKISLPVLTDVHLDMEQAPTSDMFPFPLPAIFSGGQLVVVGRYREAAPPSP